jgi:CubicO group peptidase (beta-lactamase class C family)
MTNKVLTFQWQPGTRTGYSGEGYFYVARFTQNKAQHPFDELAQQYVLDPIGMTSTSFTPRDWFTGRLAAPYSKDGFFAPQLTSTWSAADLVRTTPSDYARFVISVMHNEGLTPAIASQRLTMTRDWTKPEDLKTVCAFELPNTPCNFAAGMGLGWQVITHNGVVIADHSGSDIGAHTLAFFIPGKKIGAVIFTNGENGSKVISEIVRILSPDPVYAATIQ